MHPDAQPFVPRRLQNGSVSYEITLPTSSSVYSADELVQPVSPASSTSDMSSVAMSAEELEGLNQSLCQALVKEREGHKTTKTALKTALTEVETLAEKIRSLKATTQMLQVILRHNPDQPKSSSAIQKKYNLPDEQFQQAAVKTFFAKDRTTTQQQKLILYDVLAAQREDYETQGYPEKSDFDATSAVDFARQKEHDALLFDLSQFNNSSQTSIEFSEEQRAVLRQLLHEGDWARAHRSQQELLSQCERRECSNADHLAEISPPADKSNFPLAAKSNRHHTSVSTQKEPHQRLTLANMEKFDSPDNNTTNDSRADSEKTPTKAPRPAFSAAQLSETPMLQLPPSFLAKYNANVKMMADQAAGLPLTSPTVTNKSNFSEPVKVTRSAIPLISSKSARDYTLKMLPEFYDPTINWVMHSNRPVFDDEQEKRWARGGNNPKSHFWEHPVRYLPNYSERNLYRTVMIDFIPLTATYKDVLAHIRSGPLESIQLFPPVGHSTNFLTARVVFHSEEAAFDLAQAHDSGYGGNFKIHGKTLRVWQVLQPTYPASRLVEEDVFKHGYTRLLLLLDAKQDLLARLHEKISVEMNQRNVISIGRAHDGVPVVEFTSVRVAGDAYRRLQRDPEFQGVVFDFEEDYCNGAKGVPGPV